MRKVIFLLSIVMFFFKTSATANYEKKFYDFSIESITGETINFTKLVKPKKTILTNLHVDLDYFKLKKKLPKNIIPAFDGLSFNF